MALLRAARFPEAEAGLRALAAGATVRPEVFEMLGVAISAQGRAEEALPWFERALALRPAHPATLHNRARALLALGRHAEARADLEGALARDPDTAAAWTLLAVVMQGLGDLAAAEKALRRALVLRPDSAEGRYNLANILRLRGNSESAFVEYALAVQRDPGLAPAWLNWGAALREAGRVGEAIARLTRALELRPDWPPALVNLGVAHFAQHHFGQAVECYRRALALQPDYAEALTNLGHALAAQGEFDEALAAHEAVARMQPQNPAAHNDVALQQQERGDLAAARASLERALALAPQHADALCNMGLLLEGEGRRDEAMEYFRRALTAQPRHARAGYNLALAHLHRGEFAQGWALADHRFATVPPVTVPRLIGLPRFTAADWGRGRRIAIWREQGLGDQLLYATLLPSLEARGERFVVELDRRLLPGLARAHPDWSLTTIDESDTAFGDCDRQLALGSLGELLRPDAASFEAQPRALVAAAEGRAARYRTELGEAALRIGISWRSFQPKARGRVGADKSAPLAAFRALSQRAGTQLVDLQYGDTAAERASFADAGGRLARIEGLDLFNDIDGLLAAIAACDMVVTTSNVTAHLAGALGKRTLLVYLRGVAPFHYWVPRPDGRSLWYPSVEVVTGRDVGTWDAALARVHERLA
jgi:tetratricopeptide (TPR) repeat protein